MNRSRSVLWLALAVAAPALAQAPRSLFLGPNDKAPRVVEDDIDRRFARSKFAKALNEGTDDPNCQQLLRAMLLVVGEIGPTIDRYSAFFMDQMIAGGVATQLTTPRFPAGDYVQRMVRRVLIDGKLPDAWLATAEKLDDAQPGYLDMGRLRYLNDGVRPADNIQFSLNLLRAMYVKDVVNVTGLATRDAVSEFRDKYLDREVAWWPAIVDKAGILKAPSKKKKGAMPAPPEPEKEAMVLRWFPPDPHANEIQVFKAKPPPPVELHVRLADRQYLDREKIASGEAMIVKGRFWEMNQTVEQVEIRDAIVFYAHDYSGGIALGDPNQVMACPVAVNELIGVAPNQPGGFGHHL